MGCLTECTSESPSSVVTGYLGRMCFQVLGAVRKEWGWPRREWLRESTGGIRALSAMRIVACTGNGGRDRGWVPTSQLLKDWK